MIEETQKTDFTIVAEEICELHKRKNADYGNSFPNLLEKFGLLPAVMRIYEKSNRFEVLVNPKYEQSVKDESIRDTLIDIAAYAIMTINFLDKRK